MPSFDANRWIIGAVQVLIVVFAISLREAAKAWMADRCGDPTPRSLGRVSLNPQRHLDFFGSLLLPAMMAAFGGPIFGYGRTVGLAPTNLRDPRRDEIVISLAGPAANLGLAVLATVAMTVALAALGPGGQETAWAALQLNFSLLPDIGQAAGLPHFPLLFVLVQTAYLNVFLAIFHLLPLPPLDGGQIFLHMLPPDWSSKYAAVRPYGMLIAMILAIFRVVTLVSAPAVLLLWLLIQIGGAR